MISRDSKPKVVSVDSKSYTVVDHAKPVKKLGSFGEALVKYREACDKLEKPKKKRKPPVKDSTDWSKIGDHDKAHQVILFEDGKRFVSGTHDFNSWYAYQSSHRGMPYRKFFEKE